MVLTLVAPGWACGLAAACFLIPSAPGLMELFQGGSADRCEAPTIESLLPVVGAQELRAGMVRSRAWASVEVRFVRGRSRWLEGPAERSSEVLGPGDKVRRGPPLAYGGDASQLLSGAGTDGGE